MWEKKVGELQARCSTLEEEKYEALAKVRESVQVAEEAALQKDQVRHSQLPFLLPAVALRRYLSPRFSTLVTPFADSLPLSPPAGLVKGETESRGAGEDERGHQAADSGRRGPHQKRGERLIKLQPARPVFWIFFSAGSFGAKSVVASSFFNRNFTGSFFFPSC